MFNFKFKVFTQKFSQGNVAVVNFRVNTFQIKEHLFCLEEKSKLFEECFIIYFRNYYWSQSKSCHIILPLQLCNDRKYLTKWLYNFITWSFYLKKITVNFTNDDIKYFNLLDNRWKMVYLQISVDLQVRET